MLRNILVACVLLLSACAHTGNGLTPCVRPSYGFHYCLLPPAAMQMDEKARLVHVQGADFEQYFVSRIAVRHSQLVMNASSLLGQPLFEIRYAEQEYGESAVTMTPASAPVRADWLLAILQIAEADLNDLRGTLSGATVTERDSTRYLRDDRNKTILVVSADTTGKVVEIPSQKLVVHIRVLDTGTGER